MIKNIPKWAVVMVTWPTLNFDAPNDISGMAEARIVKFCMQVDIRLYQISAYGGKSPLKWPWLVTWPFLNFATYHIFVVGEAKHFKFRVLINK